MAAGQAEGEHLQEGGQRYVELFVIVDDEMVRFHQEDVMNYTLAVLNIVSRRYIDPSLTSQIRMAIVKIVVTETQDLTMTGIDGSSYTLTIRADGTRIVHDLKSWQYEMNPRSDDDPLHFDNTMLITRRDLYLMQGTHKDRGVLGMAPTGSICRRTESINVDQDIGLQTGLIIAHELGHNLNLQHDPHYGCQNGRNVMSSTKTVGAASFKWSQCSSDELAIFLKSPATDCLLDKPSPDLIPIHLLAGTEYTRLQQCRKKFGINVVHICGGPLKDVYCQKFPSLKNAACTPGCWSW
eukprot:XP_011681418.1 PREDICTED: A disintegrin and metalloproteinase with thrombospondin motifs 5-like [Strongylocentrotus purpuratus]